ncbi:conserved hypothetical protein [Trichinella spiralis]|uniref:hypothetical protein n=1 Tax=Trichinella spiralis TaxID=6334 RepID=UPI0001EFC56C|nr:conserved hypothetical protein [Trichinella spiralis]
MLSTKRVLIQRLSPHLNHCSQIERHCSIVIYNISDKPGSCAVQIIKQKKPQVHAYFLLVLDGKIPFESFFSPFGSSFITNFLTASSAVRGTMTGCSTSTAVTSLASNLSFHLSVHPLSLVFQLFPLGLLEQCSDDLPPPMGLQ